MSIRTATMSNSYSPGTQRPAFFRRLVVTLLYVAAITGLMALFYVYQKNLSRLWMTVFATLSIGLASGSISRIIFYHRSGFFRFITVLLNVPGGLFLLGVLTNWGLGIGPLNPWAKGFIPQDELIQLGGALLVAFICLDGWWKPPPKRRDVAEAQYSSRSRDYAPAPAVIQPAQPRQQAQARESLSFPPKKNSQLKFMKAAKSRNRTSTVNESFFTHTAQPGSFEAKQIIQS